MFHVNHVCFCLRMSRTQLRFSLVLNKNQVVISRKTLTKLIPFVEGFYMVKGLDWVSQKVSSHHPARVFCVNANNLVFIFSCASKGKVYGGDREFIKINGLHVLLRC